LAPRKADGEIRELVHTAEITVEPIEGFLEPRRVGESVAGFEEDMTLFRGWGAQKTEERLLTAFDREHEVVSPIDHQDRDLNVWCEVDGIFFR
jgi:hypothetical protein